MKKKPDIACPENASSEPAQQPAHPCILVIFGIAGDLTKRLLYPAICNLGSRGLLDENFYIVGVAVEKYTTKTFRTQMEKNVQQFVTDPAAKKFGLAFLDRIYYIAGDFDDDHTYAELKTTLKKLEDKKASKNCLFYFAAPPDFIGTLATGLKKENLLTEKDGDYFRRIIVEKPFGCDLASAKNLNRELLTYVEEKQIFRIDHFLGKETVQNLLAFRFSNGIFEPIWNRRYIDHVQITVAETIGIGLRGAYYEKAGALRDMVPNHILQLLSLITMEPPVAFTADYIQDEKSKVLHAIQVFTPEQVLHQAVRGQYGSGKMGSVEVPAYRSEPNVNPESLTETYVALKMMLDNWRWLHVPFYVRTGKHLQARSSEIVIQFKSEPAILFGGAGKNVKPNLLRIKIQPDEGISLRFNAKIPGQSLQLGQVDMNFKYSDYFGIEPRTGYETVLYDCMNGDHTLFERAEMVETAWGIIQPIIDVWHALPPRNFPNYAAGSWGPKEADDLLTQDDRVWIM
ncbi:MAG: glucose-6-phosphate dehydrogenase [Gammaproteobacteria bacterium]|nr:glucose-6-phosphate dehydrogenase [Gammaproteobacteria bacterium]